MAYKGVVQLPFGGPRLNLDAAVVFMSIFDPTPGESLAVDHVAIGLATAIPDAMTVLSGICLPTHGDPLVVNHGPIGLGTTIPEAMTVLSGICLPTPGEPITVDHGAIGSSNTRSTSGEAAWRTKA